LDYFTGRWIVAVVLNDDLRISLRNQSRKRALERICAPQSGNDQ
jgi:hypothetical protein